MNRGLSASSCRLLCTMVAAALLISCSSTTQSSPDLESHPAEAETAASYRLWEESTRDFADNLMAEAQRLKAGGEGESAVALADDAICLVLDLPSGYPIGSSYLDFVADLINEADEIEAALQPAEDEFAGIEGEEYVLLPPIDADLDVDVITETVMDSLLPPSDFPLERNSTVDRYLEAMTAATEYNRRIEAGLARAGTYLPMIRARFADAGLPQDLSYLPLIESAFSVKAYSRARAHGMWQFISSTGRHYGLDVGSLVDERRDPERSTDAAVAFLSDLYRQFDDWYLALAAYNSGAGNVRRAIRRSGSRDFWALRRYLPRETRNYVPAFIASVIVAKHPEKYGFTAPTEKPWDFDSIQVPDALDLQFLAKESGIPLADLRELNPAIRRDLTPARSSTTLRLPIGTATAAEAVLASTPRDEWAPRMIHTVRSGDSLYAIARRYGSSVSAIRQANALRGSLIRPGQTLIVPRFGRGEPVADPQPRRMARDGVYRVQKNDTLSHIARGFSVSVDSLCAANGLSRQDVIRPGQLLVIPGSSAGSSRAARTQSVTDSGVTHTVREGDTLYDIAREYAVSVSALKQINGLSSSRIYPGKRLRIPAPAKPTDRARATTEDGTYRVKKGDTLSDIAQRFGVSISELQRVNGLSTSRIYPGDVLRIPTSQAKS
ncbi:MAG: LysM peptidoglycan-binding domain-containing protein [Acidobacteria bacterium]|nr:LysM peptidoglycan-binding domain-containing protein [Acidobacteriota bacterium]